MQACPPAGSQAAARKMVERGQGVFPAVYFIVDNLYLIFTGTILANHHVIEKKTKNLLSVKSSQHSQFLHYTCFNDVFLNIICICGKTHFRQEHFCTAVGLK